VQADIRDVPLADGQFQLAMALDVLEHVDPAEFLLEARRLVEPGGWLLLSVPAFASLWSPHDDAAGHRCRYRRAGLTRELEGHGWSVIHWTHYQALLFPLLWMARRSGIARLLTLERHPPGWTSPPLGFINAVEVRLFGQCRLRWGSSLVVLARKR
jgi:SAM-dependent methyltransferase